MGRFLSTYSYLGRSNLVDRPWIDEWIDWLRQLIIETWPSVNPKKPKFEMQLSRDVDIPAKFFFHSPLDMALRTSKKLMTERSPSSALSLISKWRQVRKHGIESDPYYNFDWIMHQSEIRGLTSRFFFICGHTGGRVDGNYDIEDASIVALIKSIDDRGHIIGLHPSFGSWTSADILRAEKQRLLGMADNAGIHLVEIESRQHFLRWRTPFTTCSSSSEDPAGSHINVC